MPIWAWFFAVALLVIVTLAVMLAIGARRQGK